MWVFISQLGSLQQGRADTDVKQPTLTATSGFREPSPVAFDFYSQKT